MNRVLLEFPLYLELKSNETDRHLGWYEIVKTYKNLKSLFSVEFIKNCKFSSG